MSSFLGSRVAVQLNRGGQVEGKIVHIDGNTGTLSIQQDGPMSSTLNITRAEIADLQIIQSQTSITPTISNKALNDPAILSVASSSSSSPANSTPKHQHKQIPTGPAAMQGTPSNSRNNKQKQSKGQRSGTATPDFHSTKMSKAKGSHQGKRSIQDETEPDLDEDFDFDKALKSFDKKKIWEEIKTSDKSDPNLLLVSHNRKRSEFANGQEKLAWDQPVLSPSPPPSSSLSKSKQDSHQNGGFDLTGIQSELERVRGNALQKDVELSSLRDQLRKLQEKGTLLEALGGLEAVADKSSNGESEKWNVTLYESVSAHSEAVKKNNQKATGKIAGRLVVSFSQSAGKLRYLGPVSNLSDENVVERLPSQYQGNEIGLKPETASVFMRRIKDSIQPSSNT